MEVADAPAAEVTWTLSLGQAESLLPDRAVRRMLVLAALLDGHGIPRAIFSTPSIAAYLGQSGVPFSPAAGPKPAWDLLLVLERVGLITIHRAGADPVIMMDRCSSQLSSSHLRQSKSRLRERPRARCWRPGQTMSRSRGQPKS